MRGSTRPDAAAYVATAEIAGRIGELYHRILRPPAVAGAEPYLQVPGTSLVAPASDYAALQRFAKTCQQSVSGVAGPLLRELRVRGR